MILQFLNDIIHNCIEIMVFPPCSEVVFKVKKIICSLLVFISLFSLCSCAEKTDTVSVSDGYGKKYTVMLDDNGFVKKDEYGKMLVVETDKDGKAVLDGDGNMKTSAVDTLFILTDGENVECSDFRLPIPEGWKLTGEEMVKLIHESTGAEISFSLRSSASQKECVSQIKEAYEEWKPDWEESNIKFAFGDARLLKSSKLLANTEKYYYVFSHNENSYIVQASIYGGNSDGVNFEEIINSICFR